MKRPVYINETNIVNDVIFKNKFVSAEGEKKVILKNKLIVAFRDCAKNV